MGRLSGRRVANRATDGVERVEFEHPRRALDDLPAFCERIGAGFATSSEAEAMRGAS